MRNLFTNNRSKLLTALTSEASVKIMEMSNEIIRCFTKGDKAALEELFCLQTRNSPDFQKDFDALFDFFKCDLYSNSKINNTAGGGELRESGRRIKWYITPEIPYISVLIKSENNSNQAMEGRYYSIKYSWCITNENDITLEGLYYIEIELLNVDKIKLGDYNLLY